MLDADVIQQICSDNDRTLRKKYQARLQNDLPSLQQNDRLLPYIKRDYPQGADVIELGCGWGMVSYANLILNPELFKDWTCYECDKSNVQIIQTIFAEMVSQGYKGLIPKVMHTSISNSRKKQQKFEMKVNKHSDQHTIVPEVYQPGKKPIEFCPNMHYNRLPSTDVVLIDIEGQEEHLDYNKIDSHYYHVETHSHDYTKKLTEQIQNSNNFKLLDVTLVSRYTSRINGQAVITFKKRSRDDNTIKFRNRVSRNTR